MPLQGLHRESTIATLVQVIDELELEVMKTIKSTKGNESTDNICEVSTEWTTVDTVEASARVRNVDYSLEGICHDNEAEEHRDKHVRLQDTKGNECGGAPEDTLGSIRTHLRQVQVNNRNIPGKPRKNPTNWI